MSAEDKTKPIADMFEQTTKTYEQMLKNGMKLQQESTRWWANALTGAGSSEMQKRVKEITDEVIPQTQKSIDQWLKVMEENSRTSIDLLKKASAVSQATSLQDAQAKMFGFWEASLNAVCDRTQAITQINTKMLESWLGFARKAGDTAQYAGAKS